MDLVAEVGRGNGRGFLSLSSEVVLVHLQDRAYRPTKQILQIFLAYGKRVRRNECGVSLIAHYTWLPVSSWRNL